MRGAGCWSDHRLNRSKMSFRITPKIHRTEKNTPPQRKINTLILNDVSIQNIVTVFRRNWTLLERMHSSHKAYILDKSSAALKSQYLSAKHTARKGSARWRTRGRKRKRGIFRKRLTNITPGSSTVFYESLRAVYGPRTSGSSPVLTVLSLDNEILLTDKPDILNCWVEHFNALRLKWVGHLQSPRKL